MTGRLKVYDADTGQWSYVDGAGAQANLLRYVPLNPHQGSGIPGTTTSAIGVTHSPTLSFLPTNAVAVSLICACNHTAITPSARWNIFAYDPALGGANLRGQLSPGKVSGHYDQQVVPYVELGGDRQFDHSVALGVAGTIGLIAYVSGYWVIDVSTAIATGGGSLIGVGSSFPVGPALYDRFYRTDLLAEFTWNGTAWVDRDFNPAPGMFTQSGTVTVTTSGTYALVFPRPFSAPPTVVVSQASGSRNYNMTVAPPTATGVTIISAQYSASSLPVVPATSLSPVLGLQWDQGREWNMTAPDVIVIVALVASAIEEVRAEGKAVVYWVTMLICVAILWHLFPWA